MQTRWHNIRSGESWVPTVKAFPEQEVFSNA